MTTAPPLELGIVTSCYNYGQYLEDWARSITELTTPPTMVAIVDNGSTDETPVLMAKAAHLLEEAGLEVRTRRIEKTDFGTARNAAVALASTEWVMHLDADDMVMSHCLDDVAKLAPEADVVALGYQRCGDLRSGPSNRTRTYKDSCGRGTLRSKAPASGVSPFRRRFWERSPYRTDMTGGWDTALWIGFGHLEARFKATHRPCFFYRQHGDSIFNRRRKSSRRSAVVGRKLTLLRQGASGVSVIVPFRTDHGPRAEAWAWVRRRYELLHPEWEIVEGRCSGVWRKGEAVADALSRATGDTLVIADADCVVAPEALEEAVRMAPTVPWVVPHQLVKRLDQASSSQVLAEEPEDAELGGSLCRKAYDGFAGGGFVVVDRARYEAAGGMPTEFTGWGAEDEALAVILDTLHGAHHRLSWDLWHLWHPPGGRRQSKAYRRNQALLRRYLGARGKPDRMWALIQGLEGSLTEGPDVTMRARRPWKRGREEIAAGALFQATEMEARRHTVRKSVIAQRVR